MKAILTVSLILLSSTSSFADTRVGKEFCMKFAKESVEKTFEGRNFSGSRLQGYYKEFSYNDDVDAYIQKVGVEATASMRKLCASKGENVTIEDMSHDLRFECMGACAVGDAAFKKPFIGSKYSHNIKVGKYGDYCSELCAIPDHELDNMLIGVKLQAKNQAPDCTGAVADKGRGIDVKSLSMDEDPGNAVAKKFAKEAAKKASGK